MRGSWNPGVRWHLGVALALALLLALPALCFGQGGGEGDRVAQAKKHYELGGRYYSEGRYAEAVEELTKAYELTAETVLLYNIAKSYEKLGKIDEAIRSYRDYIDLTPSIAPADRKDVERAVADLLERKKAKRPQIIIRSNPRGADIYIDSKTKILGQTPSTFRIEAGPHKVVLEKKGFETIEKDFVMPTGKPLILEFELKPEETFGNLQIVANVEGARIFIDGKNVGITPYKDMPSLEVGAHQVILEKAGYLRWEKQVQVEKGRTTLVTANLVFVEEPSAAPAVLGWTSFVLGGLAIGGALTANHFAEQKFNDTEEFLTLHNLEFAGYVSGGALLTLASTLIIYDLVREDPTEKVDRPRPVYGSRDPSGPTPLGFGLAPSPDGGLQIGASFAF